MPLIRVSSKISDTARKSSNALLAIIDDILDLAMIDVDAMVAPNRGCRRRKRDERRDPAIAGSSRRKQVELQIVAPEKIGAFRGDFKAGAPNPLQPALERDRLLASRAGGFARRLAPRRRRCVQGRRSRTRHPARVFPTVFDRFELNTTGSRHRGVGLGLSIVRAFMEMHGGKILIELYAGRRHCRNLHFSRASSEGRAASDHQFRSNQSPRRTRRERTHARSRREFAGASRSQGRQVAASADQRFQHVLANGEEIRAR